MVNTAPEDLRNAFYLGDIHAAPEQQAPPRHWHFQANREQVPMMITHERPVQRQRPVQPAQMEPVIFYYQEPVQQAPRSQPVEYYIPVQQQPRQQPMYQRYPQQQPQEPTFYWVQHQ